MIQITTEQDSQDIRFIVEGLKTPKLAIRKWFATGEIAFYIYNEAVGAYVSVWLDKNTYQEILQLLTLRDVDGLEITGADADWINERISNGK